MKYSTNILINHSVNNPEISYTLFERNQFSLLTSGLVGSNDTYSDEVVHSGHWDDFSYSLGQFHLSGCRAWLKCL